MLLIALPAVPYNLLHCWMLLLCTKTLELSNWKTNLLYSIIFYCHIKGKEKVLEYHHIPEAIFSHSQFMFNYSHIINLLIIVTIVTTCSQDMSTYVKLSNSAQVGEEMFTRTITFLRQVHWFRD